MKKLFLLLLTFIFSTVLFSQSYISETSVYDDFKSNNRLINDSTGGGLFPWISEGLNFNLDTINNGAFYTISQEKGAYEPFGFTFGENPMISTPVTIDLSGQAVITLDVTNNYDSTLRFRVQIVDIDDHIIDTYAGANDGDVGDSWQYEPSVDIAAGEREVFEIDLSDGVFTDYANNIVSDLADFHKIKGIHLTVINTNLDENDSYQPYPIYDASFTIHSLLIEGGEPIQETGCMDEQALNYNPNAVIQGLCEYDTTIEIIGCMNPEAINYNINANVQGTCEYQDTITERYIALNGLYDDFKSSGRLINNSTGGGIFPWNTDELVLDRIEHGAFYTISQEKGAYEPFGFTFGENSMIPTPVTIDLSGQAVITLDLTNNSDSTLKFWVQLVDIDNHIVDSYSELKEDDIENAWQYQSTHVLGAGERESFEFDLTGGVFADYNNSLIVDLVDFSKIKGIYITVINNNSDADDSYQPYKLENASIVFHSLHIDGGTLQFPISNTQEVFGCMDSQADNYNSGANLENGSCYYTILPDTVFGCNIDSALNFNPQATENNQTCIYEQTILKNIPLDVASGQTDVDTIIVSDVQNCDIDFNSIIDSVDVLMIEEISSNEILVTLRVYQNNSYYDVPSNVDITNLLSDILLTIDLVCNQAGLRVSSENNGKVTLITLLRQTEIQIVLGNNNLRNKNSFSFTPNPTTSTLQIISNEVEISSVIIKL